VSRKKKNAQGDVLTIRKSSRVGDIWNRLKKNKPAMISLVFIALLILCAIFAPYLTKYDYAKQTLMEAKLYPSSEHIFGTDDYGRDLFTRVLYGTRISLLVAFLSTIVSVVISLVIGATAGYFGGKYDNIVMRIMDIITAIPGMLLAICFQAAFGTGIVNTAIAISLGSVPILTRILRSSVMLLQNEEYLEAARACGSNSFRIIMKHVIPNTLAPILVQTSLRISDSIIAISGLSFIGLGVQPPTPEWGNMLAAGREYIRTFWPMMVYPGIALALTILAFNLLGDGLRDAMDPRLKK